MRRNPVIISGFIVVATVLIATVLATTYGSLEERHFVSAAKPTTEAQLNDAIKRGGWIYATGTLTGQSNVKSLVKEKSNFLKLALGNTAEYKQCLQKVQSKGPLLRVKIQRGEWRKHDDKLQFAVEMSKIIVAPTVSFLGRQFENTDDIVPEIYTGEIAPLTMQVGQTTYRARFLPSGQQVHLRLYAENGNILASNTRQIPEEEWQRLLAYSRGERHPVIPVSITVAAGVVALGVLWGRTLRKRRAHTA